MIGRARVALASMTGAEGRVGLAAVGTLGVSLVGTAIRFVLQVLLANWMTQAAYGLFIVARSWGELLAKLPSRGYKLSAIRHLPAYENERQWELYRGFVRSSSVETLVLGVVVAGAASAIYARGTAAVDPVFLVGFALAPALALLSMWRSLLQAAHRYVPALALSELAQPLIFGAAIGCAALAFDLTPTVAVSLWVFSIATIAIAEAVAMHRWMPGPRNVRASRADRSIWTRSARTDFVAQVGIAALQVIDVIIIGWLLGETEAALYAVATRIAVLGRIVNSGLESVVSPRITAAYKRDDLEGLQEVVDNTIRISTWPTLLFGLGVAAMATPILRLFDDSYVEARTVLWILLIGNLVNALTGPSGFVTSMTGAERSYGAIMAIHACALGIGAASVAGAWGIVGVAVVRTTVNVSWNVILSTMAWRRLRVRCYPRASILFARSTVPR